MENPPSEWRQKAQIGAEMTPICPWDCLITRRSLVQVQPPQPHCATKKDIAPENPEAATVSGFFRVHFWLHEKKISSHLFHVRWGLELKLRAFAPNFEWATRKNFCFFENYFVKFLWTKWFVLKCSTNHFSIPHILAVTFLRWRPFFFSDKIKMRAQRALRTGGN